MLAYDYKNETLHFQHLNLKLFSSHNVCSLFVAFKDQIIFISPDNCLFKVAHHTWIKFLKSRRNSLMMKNEVTYNKYGYTKSI